MRPIPAALLTVLLLVPCALAAEHRMDHAAKTAAVDPGAAKIVTVAKADEWEPGGLTIMTQAVAVKETGPKETVAKFGEIYAFSPNFLAVKRETPTLIRFWNLQPDDEHDFALLGSKGQVLFYFKLPPLGEAYYTLTFHKDGVFNFECPIHRPNMNGQILVLPR